MLSPSEQQPKLRNKNRLTQNRKFKSTRSNTNEKYIYQSFKQKKEALRESPRPRP